MKKPDKKYPLHPTTVNKVWALLASKEKQRAIILMFLMLIGMVLEMLGVGMVVPAVALLIHDEISTAYPALNPILNMLGNPTQETLMIYGMLVLISVYLAKTFFLAYLAWQQNHFAYDVQKKLSQQLFTIYLRQPYTFHLQRNSAQLIQNIINEVSLYSGRIMIPLLLLITESMVLLGIGILLLMFEPIGALIVILVLGSASFGFHLSTRSKISHWGKIRLVHEGLRLQHLQQGLGGAKEVKLLGREKEFLAQFNIHNSQSARVSALQITLQQLPRLWLELLAVIGLAIIVLSMLAQGKDMSGIMPVLGLFAAAAFRLMPSVNRILSSVQSLRYGFPVIDTLYKELMLDAPDFSTSSSENQSVFQNDICLTDVSFTYTGAQSPALKCLSMNIKLGESIGFIGSSGSGKSTLVDIVLGLLEPDSGKVEVDYKNIQQNLRSWQNQIGYVPQSIYLTDDTLMRNIAFGLSNDDIDESSVWNAIKAAQLDEYVAGLPDGIQTIVGERGIRLSGGQRQRIGIARALYHDPAILVLDEATSALDEATEKDVMKAVNALHGKKTLILIAHRLTTVKNCDRLYRLESGQVVEEGSPESMLVSIKAISS